MKKVTLKATDPSGVVVTRTTARSYSHVVFARKSRDYWMRVAAEKWPHFDANFWHHQGYLDGTSPFYAQNPWERDDLYRRRIETAKKVAEKVNRGCKTPDELWELVKAENVARAEAMDCKKWRVLGWCSRHDLAVRLMNSEASDGRYSDIRIVEVS